MQTLLDIKKPKSNSFIIWEHVMKSVVAFIGAFASMIFLPMIFEGKHRRHRSENSSSLVDFLFHHPEIQIGVSIVAFVAMNAYLIYKNRKIKYIVKIEYDADKIRFGLTNLYFSKQQELELPLADFEFHLEKKVTENNEKQRKIVFRNARKNALIGEIKPDHLFWADHLLQIREVLEELQAYRRPDVSETSPSMGIGTLWK